MFCQYCGKATSPDARFCPSCGKDLATSAAGAIAAPPADPYDYTFAALLYAGFWKRVAAYILDSLILLIPSLVVWAIFGAMTAVVDRHASEATFQLSGNLPGILVSWLYYAAMESSAKQATLGKLALGIKVVDTAGNRISFGRASGRFFGMILSALLFLIGFLMVAFTKRKQGLHDMLAGCLVVNKDATPIQIQQARFAPGMSGWAIAALVIAAVAVPVTGILAAIAIPAYQDFTGRAKVAEALALSAGVKAGVTQAILAGGTTPETLESMGLTRPSANVSLVSVDGSSGIIRITMATAPVAGQTLELLPAAAGDTIVWRCRSKDIPQRFLPTSCR
jgi:uncharacterized RDD family membrane protein YckC/Tfp pilus assembly major pilin PilA